MKILYKNSMMWLIPGSEIASAIQGACKEVRAFYQEHSSGVTPDATYQVDSYFQGRLLTSRCGRNLTIARW